MFACCSILQWNNFFAKIQKRLLFASKNLRKRILFVFPYNNQPAFWKVQTIFLQKINISNDVT